MEDRQVQCVDAQLGQVFGQRMIFKARCLEVTGRGLDLHLVAELLNELPIALAEILAFVDGAEIFEGIRGHRSPQGVGGVE